MIHMLSSFDLKPGEDFADFTQDYAAFLADLKDAGMIASVGPLALRVENTPMDTDEDRSQKYFSVMSFHNRAQLDAAYAHIESRQNPGTAAHLKMYRRLTNSVFLCWEDSTE